MSGNVIKTYSGEELDALILKPLDKLITSMNKYTVLPIYVCNFLISKIDYVPKIVLAAYDDKALITEISASNTGLEETLMAKAPQVVYPTVLVFGNDIPVSSVISNFDEMYWYSTSFVIYGKGFKDLVKGGTPVKKTKDDEDGEKPISGSIKEIRIVQNGKSCSVEIDGDYDEQGLISAIPSSADVVKLPFGNYKKKHPSYENIIALIAENSPVANISDQTVLAKLLDDVKEEQAAFIPGTNDQLFKDFYKMRPTAMSVYHIRESIKEDLNIVDVALIMSYKSGNLTHVVFYRYIENVVQKIIGNYEEL